VVSAHIYPGSSGSPVFNMEGEVAGVIFALLRSEDPAQTLGLAVSAEELILFLQEEGFN
jgi:V8-like Glu-specific endopeptidase